MRTTAITTNVFSLLLVATVLSTGAAAQPRPDTVVAERLGWSAHIDVLPVCKRIAALVTAGLDDEECGRIDGIVGRVQPRLIEGDRNTRSTFEFPADSLTLLVRHLRREFELKMVFVPIDISIRRALFISSDTILTRGIRAALRDADLAALLPLERVRISVERGTRRDNRAVEVNLTFQSLREYACSAFGIHNDLLQAPGTIAIRLNGVIQPRGACGLAEMPARARRSLFLSVGAHTLLLQKGTVTDTLALNVTENGASLRARSSRFTDATRDPPAATPELPDFSRLVRDTVVTPRLGRSAHVAVLPICQRAAALVTAGLGERECARIDSLAKLLEPAMVRFSRTTPLRFEYPADTLDLLVTRDGRDRDLTLILRAPTIGFHDIVFVSSDTILTRGIRGAIREAQRTGLMPLDRVRTSAHRVARRSSWVAEVDLWVVSVKDYSCTGFGIDNDVSRTTSAATIRLNGIAPPRGLCGAAMSGAHTMVKFDFPLGVNTVILQKGNETDTLTVTVTEYDVLLAARSSRFVEVEAQTPTPRITTRRVRGSEREDVIPLCRRVAALVTRGLSERQCLEFDSLANAHFPREDGPRPPRFTLDSMRTTVVFEGRPTLLTMRVDSHELMSQTISFMSLDTAFVRAIADQLREEASQDQSFFLAGTDSTQPRSRMTESPRATFWPDAEVETSAQATTNQTARNNGVIEVTAPDS